MAVESAKKIQSVVPMLRTLTKVENTAQRESTSVKDHVDSRKYIVQSVSQLLRTLMTVESI